MGSIYIGCFKSSILFEVCRLFQKIDIILFGLVCFYSTSTIIGYLMPNPFLYIQTVLFQTIQFSISKQFSSI